MDTMTRENTKLIKDYYLRGKLPAVLWPESHGGISPERIVLTSARIRGYFTYRDRDWLETLKVIPSHIPKVRRYTQDELPAIREEKQARPFYPEVEAEKPFTSREKDLIGNALQRRPVSFLDGELHELATGGYIYPERVEYVEREAKALETGKEPGLSSMLSIKNTGNGSKQQ